MTLDAFREHLTETESPHTVKKYFADAQAFEAFRAGEVVSVGLVERWARAFNGSLNPQTVERKLAAVRRWLAFLGACGDDDAAKALGILHGGYQVVRGARERDRRIIEPVSDREFAEAMERARRWQVEWMRALMGVLWYAGPRISEVVGDAIAQIPCLAVSDGRALVEAGYVQIVGKGGKRRWLVLPSVGRECLGPWAQGRLAWAEVARGSLQPGQSDVLSAPLFASPVNPWRPVSVQRVNQLLHEYGLRGAHGFRHAYRVRLRRAGVHDEIIRALMGHGPSSVTASYGRVSLEEMQEASENLVGGKNG